VEDDVLELSEDGSFDTSKAPVSTSAPKEPFSYAKAAAAAKDLPAPVVTLAPVPVAAAPAAKAAETDGPADESEPMDISKPIDFPETDEERERKVREEEEDKTPARK